MFHNVKEWHDNSIFCYHENNTMTFVRYLTWHVEYTCYRINSVYILRSSFVCYVGFVLLSTTINQFNEVIFYWHIYVCVFTVNRLRHINVYWHNYLVYSIYLHLFTIIFSNFLIPQLYLDTEHNSCSVKYKMMKVPTCLVFPQLSASISEFQLQTFPIVPCGLNRTWFKPVMLE